MMKGRKTTMRNKFLAIVGVIAIFAMTGIASAQTNLLINGDFSLDGLGGTSTAQDALGWTEYHSGGWDNREVNAAWPDPGDYHFAIGNAGGYGAFIYQDVSVADDESEYILSVEAMLDAWWMNSLYIKLEFYDSAVDTNGVPTNMLGQVESPSYSQPGYDTGLARTTYSLQGQAPAGTVIIRALLGSYGEGGTARFDDAALVWLDPNADDDSDGLPNFWEELYSLDPNDATGDNGASGDPDSDLLVNSNEYANGTSPINPDTDGDGLDDNEEVNTYSTNPLNSDTDSDLLSDSDEVNVYGTNPLLADTDSDGEDDEFELFQGTDPLDAGSSSAILGLPTVDGTLDGFYGTAVAVQTSETSGEDNGDELDAAYVVAKNGKLYLMLTGNMATNWNKLNIFIDSTDAVITNVYDASGIGNTEFGAQNGMTFDAGFSPDYQLLLRGSLGLGYDAVNMDVAKLATQEYTGYTVISGGMEGVGRTGTGVNASPIAVALNNSNTNGVIAGSNPAIEADALAVTTGLELAIAYADIGSPTGPVRIAVVMADESNGVLFNQVLAGVPPQGSLGLAPLVDFSTIAGDQFFLALDGSTDSDSDGMTDIWEESYGLDPNDATGDNGASGDPDADGLVNIDELLNGTNPQNADTDNDGLTDNEEVNTYFTNPLYWDTDGDGLSDIDEITIHGTNPLLADSDSDGDDDWFELLQGTDPLDAGSTSASEGVAIVDGTLDASLYGAAVATQTVDTAWTNNLDELDAAYAYLKNGRLFLMITGNMNTNWNSLEIFIDSSDAVTTNVFTAQGRDNTANMNGLVFDEGFSPDYHLNARLGTWAGNTNQLGEANFSFNLDYANLGTGQASWQDNAFNDVPEGIRYMGTGDANTNSPVAIGFDNSNTAGVGFGGGAANQANALAVSTGLELSIALADLGNPVGEIRIMAMVTGNNTNFGGDHAITCNQVLPGLAAPQAELGVTSNLNFTAIAGDQFFTVNIPVAVAAEIMSGQLVSGNTLFQLNVSKLVPTITYKVQETADLTTGFADVPGSDWTAAATNEVVTVPADTGANPEMFYQVVAP